MESRTDNRPRDDPRCGVGVFDTVRENAGYRGYYWTAARSSHRRFYC